MKPVNLSKVKYIQQYGFIGKDIMENIIGHGIIEYGIMEKDFALHFYSFSFLIIFAGLRQKYICVFICLRYDLPTRLARC